MYLGNFDSFRFTAAADTPANSVVQQGGVVGVTRDNVANGATGLAFMAAPVSVYSFTVSALGANKSFGTAVYVESDGDITFDANDGASPATAYAQLGYIWKAATAGDTEIVVALK